MIRKPKKTAHDKLLHHLQAARIALAQAALHAVEAKADHAFDKAAILHPKKARPRKSVTIADTAPPATEPDPATPAKRQPRKKVST